MCVAASGILLKGDGLDAMLQALDLQVGNAAPAIPEKCGRCVT